MVTHFIKKNALNCQISIHTTRVGGDSTKYDFISRVSDISIHTTRVGGDRLNRREIRR